MIPAKHRNPWTGVHAGRELLYDLRHLPSLVYRAFAAWRGQEQLESVLRWTSLVICIEGVGLVVVGVLTILLH